MLFLVLLLLIFEATDATSNASYPTRRIRDGLKVTTDKPYMTYFVKAPLSPRIYDAWLCGGALVNKEFILTSAACVDDVEYIYAIAGYAKYVKEDEIETNECTKKMKKKVIYTCTPVSYDLQYDKLDKWAYIDIALAKVESPYDFADASYQVACDYIPATIPINFEQRYQEPGADAMVLGWGHKDKWRKPGDNTNYNQKDMQYSSCQLIDKNKCKESYTDFPNMNVVIDDYMICSMGKGNLNDKGEVISTSSPDVDGCSAKKAQLKLVGEETSCSDEDNDQFDDKLVDVTRRNTSDTSRIYNESSNIVKAFNNISNLRRKEDIRSDDNAGICQNDHGGPLVTWVGAHEVVIGVASVFRVTKDYECVGPYLFTSTQCNGAFINCVLNSSPATQTADERRFNPYDCDSAPAEKGYDTIEKYISWLHHPAGPADNERSLKSARSQDSSDNKQNKNNGRQVFRASDRDEEKIIKKAHKDKTDIRFSAEDGIPPKIKQQIEAVYPASPSHRSEERHTYPPREIHQKIEKYAGSDRHLGNKKYSSNIRYPTHENYSAKYGYPANEHQTTDRYPINHKYQQNYRYPANSIYSTNGRYTTNAKYSVNEKYSANVQYRTNQRYPPSIRYPPHLRYPPNIRYPPNERYSSDNNRYSPNLRYPPIRRTNEKFVLANRSFEAGGAVTLG